MNLTLIIILCVAISLVLILFPLFISYKAEKEKKIVNGIKLLNTEIK